MLQLLIFREGERVDEVLSGTVGIGKLNNKAAYFWLTETAASLWGNIVYEVKVGMPLRFAGGVSRTQPRFCFFGRLVGFRRR